MKPNYKAFAIEVLKELQENSYEDVFDCAIKHGLIKMEKRTVPCGAYCPCLEFNDPGDVVECGVGQWINNDE